MESATPRTLADVPGRQAALRPDHVAMVHLGTTVTYARLHRESNRAAHALRAAGLAAGDRVAFLGMESAHYYEIAFACAKSGAVLVPVNWRLTADEVAHQLRDSGARLLFVEEEYHATAERVAEKLPDLRHVVGMDAEGRRGAGYLAWKHRHPDTDLPHGPDPADPFAVLYTSGTTGLPKGVVLPHRCFFALGRAMDDSGLDWVDWKPGDRSLIGLPGLHIAGLSWAMQGFTAGVTNVVMRMFVAQDAVALIRDLGVTTTFVAPAMLQMMLTEPAASPEAFASLRKVVYGGSPVAQGLLARSMETMVNAELVQAYAATETGNAVALLPSSDHVVGSPRLRAAGRPCPGVEIRIVADEETCPPGGVGEVWVRTPAAMLGYWNLPEATARALRDGWLRMGDAGYLDEDGYLYLCDRIKDTIIVAGENVYPGEVEEALAAHPAVAEAAVVGAPHPRWGESVHACVVVRDGMRVTPRQLLLSLKGRIADYKIPSSYDLVDALPRNATGKVLRRELRDRLWQGHATKIH
ncbi:long-chain-fatty-acid--CoA ligase [Streptomyces sp. NPDC000658]|uniref:long-chain-fatty-acid--CoA ligase n=1 Tax=Streptomyces sp. NPDC000658 TaxID=3154266 RepID=UPI00331F6B28